MLLQAVELGQSFFDYWCLKVIKMVTNVQVMIGVFYRSERNGQRSLERQQDEEKETDPKMTDVFRSFNQFLLSVK